MIHACCLRIVIVMETYFILLKSRDGNGQGIKLEEATVVDKIITYCFIEWNNTL